jgi:hypothetical protein
MTQQTINVGTVAGDNTGDPGRTAFQKINSNFGELYNGIGGAILLSSVAGSNTVTATSTTYTAYFSGSTVSFVAAGPNTGATTLNINGLGAKAITKQGSTALTQGDIKLGQIVMLTYDGTQFQLIPSKINPVISVIDFGAVGDGSTDDTAAFVAACTYASTRNVAVLVPGTSSFYALTALTTANKELLYGTGIVKVAGTTTKIPTVESVVNNFTAAVNIIKNTLSPDVYIGSGSVGSGVIYTEVKRTGGYGQYGNWLSNYLVTDSITAGEFDTGITSWAGSTNLSGGNIFGAWVGANSPAQNLGQTYTSGITVGMEINAGNRWGNYASPPTVLGSGRQQAGLFLVPDVLPALDGTNAIACTISVASPAVVTLTAHGLIANQGVVFGGGGTIPTGITAGTTYYVSATGLATDTFQISATIGGASVNTTGSFAAPVTVLPSYPGAFAAVIGYSVGGHQWWNGTMIRTNTLVANGYGHLVYGGSVAGNAPKAGFATSGFFQYGIDMTGSTCSTAPINFNFPDAYATTATAGAIASPGNFAGFLKLSLGGTVIKLGYFLA